MFFKHKIFALIFQFFNLFPLNNKKISFISDSNESFNSNFDFIKNELSKRDNFLFNIFYKDKFSIKGIYNLATSKYIFLNDNFFPLAFMKLKKETKVLQLWHAPGAFKKFGASVIKDENERNMISKISNNTDYLFTSSDNVNKFYQDAFLIDNNKIKALGVPRIDYFFNNNLDVNKIKNDFYKKYPEAKNKKIVLYAPTFRDKEEYNHLFNYFNLKEFNDNFSDEYIFTLRLHPKIKKFLNNDFSKNENYIDLTDYKNEMELLLIADVLITDYSSIMIEFATLNKPIIFFTYDYKYYLNNDRGFYFDFKKMVPGPIAENMDQLINTFNNLDFENINNKEFLSYQFNELDGKSSKRIVDFILNNE
ncbi:CDP-glycerol glycerophosphotransferase family protein [Methanobrevibacter sp. DSM 116169]|uniref:CDP-glycerol glycerophosphotransferase family protein n=1 Tax=Methanobrevibacter sp. DSM 116169 TaxID=3242727 RepID=UPI0038FD30A8